MKLDKIDFIKLSKRLGKLRKRNRTSILKSIGAFIRKVNIPLQVIEILIDLGVIKKEELASSDDSGYIYAPSQPLYSSNTITQPVVHLPHKAILMRYAMRPINRSFYGSVPLTEKVRVNKKKKKVYQIVY